MIVAFVCEGGSSAPGVHAAVQDIGHQPRDVGSLNEAVECAELVFFPWPADSLDIRAIHQTIRSAARREPPVRVVLLSTSPLESRAYEAFDCLRRQPTIMEIREEILAAEHDGAPPSEELHDLRKDLLIGESKAFLDAIALIPIMARSELTVLLSGETGTGKENFAKAIHRRSRANHPYEVFDCAKFQNNAEVLLTELCGSVPGAFTGALNKPGHLEIVGKGTLLVDEVQDFPLGQQGLFRRILQERTFRRLGESRDRDFEGRIIAATNRNLEELVREKTFKEDLYERLNVLRIHVPPLRERMSDIAVLARHFIAKHSDGRELELGDAAQDVLERTSFPRNVRQLENALKHAISRCDGRAILPRHLPQDLVTAPKLAAAPASLDLSRYKTERDQAQPRVDLEYIGAALTQCRNNQSEAARLLEIDRDTLADRWKRANKLGRGETA